MANKQAAIAFANKWKDKGSETSDTEAFWRELMQKVFEVPDVYDDKIVKREDKIPGEKSTRSKDIVIYKGSGRQILVEQKSIGTNLAQPEKQSGTEKWLTPYEQADRYDGMSSKTDKASYIITCNFAQFWIYDRERTGRSRSFPMTQLYLADLPKHLDKLWMLEYEKPDPSHQNISQNELHAKAAGNLIKKLYACLLKGYPDGNEKIPSKKTQESLNELCVRVVFCLYAEDAGVFSSNSDSMFRDYLNKYDPDDWADELQKFFKILDTKEDERPYNTKKALQAFPYVNGGLFADEIELPVFDDEAKHIIINEMSEEFDWSTINPTIFGAMFESTLNQETRRSEGMHYTSLENIHKVIDPLFLDELKEKLTEAKSYKVVSNRNKHLQELQDYLSSLSFLDPACGSGNFLTETYICLRRIENEIISIINTGQIQLSDVINPIKVSIEQFYGIEVNDFAVSVARTALWIAESQMIKETEQLIGREIKDFLPLTSAAHIVEGNALRMDWNSIIDKCKLNYIMGNPPFNGARTMKKDQKDDMILVIENQSNNPTEHKNDSKNLDYVAAWYFKAARLIQSSHITVGFVSTSSICQGEQVYPLWNTLLSEYNISIDFGYEPFKWDNEALNKAQVFVTIIGFSSGKKERSEKYLFQKSGKYSGKNISPYLAFEDNIIIKPSKEPWPGTLRIAFGNQPRDGGNFILNESERKQLIAKEPHLANYILPYIGSLELLNGKKRYCIWLNGVDPSVIMDSPILSERVEKVRQFRLESKAHTTNQYAKVPWRFAQLAQPDGDFLAIPEVSSSKRKYIPMGFFHKSTIASNKLFVIAGANEYHFGVLMSSVHMAWVKKVSGRLGDGFNYSKELTYNPFPWPKVDEAQKKKIEKTANDILNARKQYQNSTLAKMYGKKMYLFPELVKAHEANDRAVMAAYGFDKDMTESEIVAELMKMYQKLVEEKE